MKLAHKTGISMRHAYDFDNELNSSLCNEGDFIVDRVVFFSHFKNTHQQ